MKRIFASFIVTLAAIVFGLLLIPPNQSTTEANHSIVSPSIQSGNFSIAGSTVVTSPKTVASVDDLVVVTSSATNKLTLLKSDNNGGLVVKSTVTVAPTPDDVKVGFYDDDSFPDIILISSGIATIISTDGQGGILSNKTLKLSRTSYRCAIAEVTGDFRRDLIVVNDSQETISIFQGDNNNNFSLINTIRVGGDARGISLVDTNQDGVLDIVVSLANLNQLAIYTNQGGGVFTYTSNVRVGTSPQQVVSFNLAGQPYLAVACPGGFTNDVYIVKNNLNGSLTVSQVLSLPNNANPSNIVTGDFDLDGLTDLAVTVHDTFSGVIFFSGQADGQFFSSNNLYVDGQCRGIALVDADQDGYSDVVVARIADNRVTVLLNNN